MTVLMNSISNNPPQFKAVNKPELKAHILWFMGRKKNPAHPVQGNSPKPTISW